MTPPRVPAVTHEEFVALQARINKLASDYTEMAAVLKATHEMTAKMYVALIEPARAYDGSLIDALTDLAINVKSGQRVAGWAVIWAKWLSAAAVIGASLYALLHFGAPPQN